MLKRLLLLGSFAAAAILSSCENPTEPATGARLIFKFKFDSTQTRLNNIGQPSTIAAGNAAQSPRFRSASAHYIELAPDALTALGKGNVLYVAPETNAGGSTAIDFSKSVLVGDNEEFFAVPLSQVKPGTYKWLRVSLAYQNAEVTVRYNGVNYPATIAGFVGFNTYINSFKVNTQTVAVNANKKQGFWAAEVAGLTFQGQAPEGAVTVPNPIFATSPIPQGSCVVTGDFSQALTISGNETQDVVVTVSLSVNKSFEWKDDNRNGLFEPASGEMVVDMGFRGMKPSYAQ
ncbi:MAG: hypothetical protein MUD08_16355 [Cytophagales bacterium]|jgi:hypothetical protein|nr:hypothetical protein [Cytophagales bacterium]